MFYSEANVKVLVYTQSPRLIRHFITNWITNLVYEFRLAKDRLLAAGVWLLGNSDDKRQSVLLVLLQQGCNCWARTAGLTYCGT